MAVKIRLSRRGRKDLALFDIVVADAKAPRDGRFIDKLGTYNPNRDPSSVELDEDKAFDWVMKGAQPTQTARNILSDRGLMLKKHLQIGVLKGAISQEVADQRFNEWKASKEAKISKELEAIAKSKEEKDKARLQAESKIREKRAEELRKKQAEDVEAAAKEEEAEAAEEEQPQEEAAAQETTAQEEAPKKESTAKESAPEEKSTAEESAPEEESTAEESAPESKEKESGEEESKEKSE